MAGETREEKLARAKKKLTSFQTQRTATPPRHAPEPAYIPAEPAGSFEAVPLSAPPATPPPPALPAAPSPQFEPPADPAWAADYASLDRAVGPEEAEMDLLVAQARQSFDVPRDEIDPDAFAMPSAAYSAPETQHPPPSQTPQPDDLPFRKRLLASLARLAAAMGHPDAVDLHGLARRIRGAGPEGVGEEMGRAIEDAAGRLEEAAAARGAGEGEALREKEAEVAELKGRLAEAESLRQQLEAAESRAAEAEAALASGDPGAADLVDRLVAAESLAGERRRELEEVEARLEGLAAELEQARGQLEQAMAQAEQGAAQLEQAGRQLQHAEVRAEAASARAGELAAELAAAADREGALAAELEALRAQVADGDAGAALLAAKDAEIADRDAAIAELEARLAAKDAQPADNADAVADLESRLAGAQAEAEDLARRLAEAEERAAAADGDLELARDECGVLQGQLRDFGAAHAALVNTLAEREAELSALRAERQASPAGDAGPEAQLPPRAPSATPSSARGSMDADRPPTRTSERGTSTDPPPDRPPSATPLSPSDEHFAAQLADLGTALRAAADENARLHARVAELEGGAARVRAEVAETSASLARSVEELGRPPAERRKGSWADKYRVLQAALLEAQQAARRQEEQIRQLGLINAAAGTAGSRSVPGSPEKSRASEVSRQQTKRLGQLLAENAGLKKAKALVEREKEAEIVRLREQLVAQASSAPEQGTSAPAADVSAARDDGLPSPSRTSPDPALLEQLAEKDRLLEQLRSDLERAEGLARSMADDSERRVTELSERVNDVAAQLSERDAELAAAREGGSAEAEALQREVERLGEEKAGLEEELRVVSEARDDALAAGEDLLRRLRESEEAREGLQLEIASLRAQGADAAEPSGLAEADVQAMHDEIARLLEQRAALEAELEAARASASDLDSMREDLEMRLADAEGIRTDLLRSVEELKGRLELVEGDAGAELASLREQLKAAERAAEEAASARTVLASELEESRRALEVVEQRAQRAQDMERAVEDADARARAVAVGEEELRTAKLAAERREAELATRLGELDAELRRTETALLQRTSEFEAERKKLMDRLDDREAAFVELNLERDSLGGLLASERAKSSDLQQSLDSAKEEARIAKDDFDQVSQRLAVLDLERRELEQDRERLVASLKDMEHHLHLAEARSPASSAATLNESAWEELGGLVRENVSRSWKVLDELQNVFGTFGIDRSQFSKDVAAAGEALDSALRKSLENASAEIHHLREQLVRATYIADTVTHRVNDLERELAESRQASALEGVVADLRFEKEAMDNQVATMRTQNRTLHEEVMQLQQQIRLLGQTSSETEKLRQEVAFFRQNLEEANRRIAELREERNEIKRRLHDSEQGHKADSDQITTLLEDLRDLTERLADAKGERQADRQKWELMRTDFERRLRERTLERDRFEQQAEDSRKRLIQQAEDHDRELARLAGEARALEDKYRALLQVHTEVAVLREENASIRSQLEAERQDAMALEDAAAAASTENLQLKTDKLALEQDKAGLVEELVELNRRFKELVSESEQTRLYNEQITAMNSQLKEDLASLKVALERSMEEEQELRRAVTRSQGSAPTQSSLAMEDECARLRATVQHLQEELDRAVHDRESVRRDRDSVLSRLKREMNEIDGVLRKREDTIRTFVELRKRFTEAHDVLSRDTRSLSMTPVNNLA